MEGITARHHSIIGEALTLAVAVDMSLPPERQAASNRSDMSDYLCTRYSPAEVAKYAWNAHRQTGLPVTAFYEGDEQGTDAHKMFWETLAVLSTAADWAEAQDKLAC